uniref:Piwi-like protein 1 n=2 Tax=Macrostomum lignano TaxID=282301 RepID=A0A1I8GLI9_9PLAT
MSQQQHATKGRGRSRGRAGPRPAEASASAASAASFDSGSAAAASTSPAAAAAASSPAPPPGLAGPPGASGFGYRQGAGATGGDSEQLAERMAGLQVGGERGGLQRKLLRYQLANVRPEGVPVSNKRGTSGAPVQVVTNYVALNVKDNWRTYQMAVDFRPMLGAKPLREKLLTDASQVPKPFVYDGGILYTRQPLNPPEGVKFEASIKSWTGEVAIRQVGEVNRNTPQWLHLMNVVLGKAQRYLNMQMVGRNFYYPDQATRLPNYGMEVWPGFEMAVKPTDGPLMLYLDPSNKFIHTNTVLDFMYDMYNRVASNQFHAAAESALVGQIVLTRHNNKTYRIDSIEWDKGVNEHFRWFNKTTRQEEQITFGQYFKQTYDIDLADDKQPLLVSKPRKRDLPPTKGGRREQADNVLLPPEVCYMTGLTDDMRADRNLMRDLATHTRVNPSARCDKMLTFARTMAGNPESRRVLGEFGLEVSPNAVEATARQLQPETVQMSRPIRVDPERADWDNGLKGNGMFQPIDCKNWIFVYFQRDEQAAADFCQKLHRVSQSLGMSFGEPYVLPVMQDRDQFWLKTIQDNINQELDLVFCLLPNNNAHRYNIIKRLCYVDKPVPSQCVLTKTIRNPAKVMSVATKVAIQISCKLGGVAWALSIPIKRTMIIGMDSYHDKRQSRSVQGVVFSLNETFTQYYSYSPIVKGGKAELHNRLDAGFTMALQKFREKNGELPARIILYRDGVGDSMLEQVKNSELVQLKQSLSRIYGDRISSLGFKVIIVKKLVSSRLFRRGGNQLRNPAPGTVLDDVITMPNYVDFFLVSQYVNQGTVTPTHYNIIEDVNDANIRPDQVQQLTYKLCHLYFNWPGTIRVPAPCQYAHRLAYLVGQNLNDNKSEFEPSPQICDRLFFL